VPVHCVKSAQCEMAQLLKICSTTLCMLWRFCFLH